MSTQLPDLRIVPTDHLHLHEDVEAGRVGRIVERLTQDQMLKNPVIVAELDEDDNFVVLDGANRATALKQMGVRDSLVQVVDYGDPDVKLDTWYHLVADIDKRELFARIGEVAGVRMRASDLQHARLALAYHQIVAYMVCRDGDVHQIDGPNDLPGRVSLLNRVAKTYKSIASIYRVQTDHMDELLRYYGQAAAVIVYPRFTPSDILELTRNAVKLPTGITRHLIPKRALRVNLPLSVLTEDRPVAEKNHLLQTQIAEMLKAGRVRYYQESTYLFDE
ncbi:MAG: hypothetical protein HYR71_03955 [Chloroflexi bacterium]|nr:hypothetical protein [Chloroflexota bacterium]